MPDDNDKKTLRDEVVVPIAQYLKRDAAALEILLLLFFFGGLVSGLFLAIILGAGR